MTPAALVMSTLLNVKRKQNELKLATGGAWTNEMNLVFVNDDGQHLHPNTLRSNLKRLCA